MELCSVTPNLAGASYGNGTMIRVLRTQFRGFYLGLKLIRGVSSGAKCENKMGPFYIINIKIRLMFYGINLGLKFGPAYILQYKFGPKIRPNKFGPPENKGKKFGPCFIVQIWASNSAQLIFYSMNSGLKFGPTNLGLLKIKEINLGHVLQYKFVPQIRPIKFGPPENKGKKSAHILKYKFEPQIRPNKFGPLENKGN